MRVWRLETKWGSGIFQDSDIVHDAVRKVVLALGEPMPELEAFDGPLSPFRHPIPQEDVPGFAQLPYEHGKSYYCGFDSIDQLLRWFDSEAVRVAMNELGTVMKIYEVDEANVLRGDAQIMFMIHRATLISETSIPTIVH